MKIHFFFSFFHTQKHPPLTLNTDRLPMQQDFTTPTETTTDFQDYFDAEIPDDRDTILHTVKKIEDLEPEINNSLRDLRPIFQIYTDFQKWPKRDQMEAETITIPNINAGSNYNLEQLTCDDFKFTTRNPLMAFIIKQKTFCEFINALSGYLPLANIDISDIPLRRFCASKDEYFLLAALDNHLGEEAVHDFGSIPKFGSLVAENPPDWDYQTLTFTNGNNKKRKRLNLEASYLEGVFGFIQDYQEKYESAPAHHDYMFKMGNNTLEVTSTYHKKPRLRLPCGDLVFQPDGRMEFQSTDKAAEAGDADVIAFPHFDWYPDPTQNGPAENCLFDVTHPLNMNKSPIERNSPDFELRCACVFVESGFLENIKRLFESGVPHCAFRCPTCLLPDPHNILKLLLKPLIGTNGIPSNQLEIVKFLKENYNWNELVFGLQAAFSDTVGAVVQKKDSKGQVIEPAEVVRISYDDELLWKVNTDPEHFVVKAAVSDPFDQFIIHLSGNGFSI